jgi:hypothetical protein
MGLIGTLITFSPGTDIRASEANANNAAIVAAFNGSAVLTDYARTIVAQHTFAPSSTNAPFLLGANALGQVVTGLRAEFANKATVLETARTINGVAFDGSVNITVPVAGSALTGTSLATNILSSSLTSLGILSSLLCSGNVVVSGTVQAGNFVGAISVPASSVTAGAFGAGNYSLGGTLTATTLVASGGQIRGSRITQTGAGGTVSFATANHVRHTMTGTGTISLAGMVGPGVYTLEILQDSTGGWVPTVSGVVWDGGVAPTFVTTANRKAIVTLFHDGAVTHAALFGRDFASTT